jgi:predicted ester cyclase
VIGTPDGGGSEVRAHAGAEHDSRMNVDPVGAHEAAYRRLMDAVGAGREDQVDELLAAEFVDHNPLPGQSPGPTGFKEWMRAARAAFPDLTASVRDVVADADRLTGRVRYRGTHGGTFLGIAATGRTVDFEAFHFLCFRNGRIVEWWGTADLLGALHQIGGRVSGPADP